MGRGAVVGGEGGEGRVVVGGGGGRGKEGGFDLGFGNFLRTIVYSGFSKTSETNPISMYLLLRVKLHFLHLSVSETFCLD